MKIELTVNGKRIQVEGEYYAGFQSRDRLEPNEPECFDIAHIDLLEDYDGVTIEYFANCMEWDQQLEFLGVELQELEDMALEVYNEGPEY